MKKILYHSNVNQVIALCVAHRRALTVFTPKQLGIPCVLVPSEWGHNGYALCAEKVEMGGNVQLEDNSVSVFTIDDIK